MASDRERRAYKEWLEQDRKEQEELAARLEAPLRLKKLQEEISKNAGKLVKLNRQSALGYREQPFIPADLYDLSFDTQEAFNEWSSLEARAFYNECHPFGWSGKPEHVQILLDYFANHDIGPDRSFPFIDRRMFRAAWLSLRNDGLFDEIEPEAPAPVPVASPVVEEENFDDIPRLPLGHQTPVAYRRDTQQSYRGIDLLTGQERDFTQLEVDRMDSETYRKVFNVPTPALTRVNFLK